MAPMTAPRPQDDEADADLPALTPAQRAALHQVYQLILSHTPSPHALQREKADSANAAGEQTPPATSNPPPLPPNPPPPSPNPPPPSPNPRTRRRASGTS